MSIKQLWQWGNVSTPLKLVFVSCYTHLQCAVSRRNLNSCGVIRVRCFPLVSCCQQQEGWERSMQGHTSLWNERFLVVENGPKHWLVLRLLGWGEIMRAFGSVISPIYKWMSRDGCLAVAAPTWLPGSHSRSNCPPGSRPSLQQKELMFVMFHKRCICGEKIFGWRGCFNNFAFVHQHKGFN